jgi:mycothiol synthase
MSRVQEDGLFVDYLGVKRQWRKQGIGLALLRQAFLETYKRGQSTVLLYVDTDSLTNAQRLYAQAGMSPDLQIALYRKML